MEQECSQDYITDTYHEPHEPIWYPHTLFLQDLFYTILLSMSRPRWYLSKVPLIEILTFLQVIPWILMVFTIKTQFYWAVWWQFDLLPFCTLFIAQLLATRSFHTKLMFFCWTWRPLSQYVWPIKMVSAQFRSINTPIYWYTDSIW
jgi:hypothetical protein